jgi:pilus assembly protein FimV
MTRPQTHLASLRVGLLSVIGFGIGLSCLSLSVHALTLAGIEVQSHKGEPLRAEISVSSATAEEWGQLVVKLAPAERFLQLGLVFSPAVEQLQIELLETTDGHKRIRLFSPQAFSDNFVDLLIEAQTASGKWVKAFTLMLKPAPVKVEAPIKLSLAASPQTQAQQTPTEHVVQKGESASQIIQKWLSEDMSTQQMLVALLKNQPDAFIQGNVNLLRAGVVLKAPTPTAVRAIDTEDARQFLIVQQKQFIAFSQAAAQNPQSINAQAPSRQLIGKVGQEDPAANTPSITIDQLKLSQAKIEKQNAETRLAAQRALRDAQKQLNTLQENVNQLVQLTASAPISVGQAPIPTHTKSAESGAGILNLNRLLEAPHKNVYLWAALTLLGVLAVWAGLRIQSRKSSHTLSTLMSSEEIGKSAGVATQSAKLEMPANIAALDLSLDLTPQANTNLGSVRSRASTETLQ